MTPDTRGNRPAATPATGDASMKLTFLGTGGVTAAPLPGCDCRACQRAQRNLSLIHI